MTDRPDKDRATQADARNFIIPIPCQHCTHLTSIGGQYNKEGWTCAAYPSQIPYTILTLREPHIEPSEHQPGELVAYNPRIYTEDETGKEWHWTANGTWQYRADTTQTGGES